MLNINYLGKLWISGNQRVPEHHIYKFLEWQRLHETLIRLDINCVIDVGAARGQFAANLRQIGYRGSIVSFEPVREAFAEMQNTFAADPLWQGYNVALGSTRGEAQFHVATESTEMSSILAPQDRSWQLRIDTVPVHTLDEYFDAIVSPLSEPRVLLKMDTQGYDIEVVNGALQSLPRILSLQSELSILPQYVGAPYYLDALRLYSRHGFEAVSLIEAARDERSGIITEFNCLLVRR